MSERLHGRCQHNAYRMSCEDFDDLWEFAKGCCQICETPEAQTRRGRLVIDHDPRFAPIAVRGLLCDRCNNMLGRIDAGRDSDPRVFRYYANAWFVRQLIANREAYFARFSA